MWKLRTELRIIVNVKATTIDFDDGMNDDGEENGVKKTILAIVRFLLIVVSSLEWSFWNSAV